MQMSIGIRLLVTLATCLGCGVSPGVSEETSSRGEALSEDVRTVIGVATDHPALGVTRTKMQIQQGSDPLNRFAVTRVRGLLGHKPLILHAPFGYGIEWLELTETSNYRQSFVGSLATLGFDVWVIDDRLSKQAPGTCEVTGCPAMGGWTLQTRVDDAEFVRGLVLDHYPPGQKLVIGGYVGGAMFAQATVNAHPTHYAGLFLWEGTLVAGEVTQAYVASSCGVLQYLTGIGVYADPSTQLFKLLFQLKVADPTGVSPLPGLPGLEFLAVKLAELGIENATNDQVFYVINTQHLDNPNWPTPSYFFFKGTPSGFSTAVLSRILKIESLVDSYASLVTLRDITCALAGDPTYTANLGAFQGKVLALGSQGGFGAELAETEGHYTNASFTLAVNGTFGESDRFFHPLRALYADLPFALWAATVY